MKRTSKFTFILFLIGAVLLSACGQVATTTAQTSNPQVTPPPQATSTPSPTGMIPQGTPSLLATNTSTPIAIIIQTATRAPTQQSGG